MTKTLRQLAKHSWHYHLLIIPWKFCFYGPPGSHHMVRLVQCSSPTLSVQSSCWSIARRRRRTAPRSRMTCFPFDCPIGLTTIWGIDRECYDFTGQKGPQSLGVSLPKYSTFTDPSLEMRFNLPQITCPQLISCTRLWSGSTFWILFPSSWAANTSLLNPSLQLWMWPQKERACRLSRISEGILTDYIRERDHITLCM